MAASNFISGKSMRVFLVFLCLLVGWSVQAQPSMRMVANTNLGLGSTIGCGGTNRIEAPWSYIAAGRNNRILGGALSNGVAVISGGEDNLMDTNANTLAGNWKGDNKHAVIGGGQLNVINGGRYGTISGGWENWISRSNTVIGGGWKNTNYNENSVIPGGYRNVIEITNDVVEAGQVNNVIGGGYRNLMSGSRASVISGGYENWMVTDSGVAPGNAYLGGGAYNIMRGPNYSALVGGIVNTVGALNGGGTYGCFLGGGQTNGIVSGNFNSIVGGYGNWIEAIAEYAFIGGGLFNTNTSLAFHGTILGGAYNRINSGSTNGVLLGYRSAVDADNAYALGNHITNITANSFEAGFNEASKTRMSDAGLLALGAFGNGATNITLAADNQSISTASRSYIRLQSDNATAGNRTFVLTQGSFTGQLLDIEWVGTNAGELVDDSAQTGAGNHRMNGTWTPTQYDLLALRFNGTDWVERSRSAN